MAALERLDCHCAVLPTGSPDYDHGKVSTGFLEIRIDSLCHHLEERWRTLSDHVFSCDGYEPWTMRLGVWRLRPLCPRHSGGLLCRIVGGRIHAWQPADMISLAIMHAVWGGL